MKNPLFVMAIVAMFGTTLTGFAADRKPRLTYREKKAAEAKAKMDELKEKLMPKTATLIQHLEETDSTLKSTVASLSPEGKDPAVIKSDLLKALQAYTGDYFFVKDMRQAGKFCVLTHEKYPADPSKGLPAVIRILLDDSTLNNPKRFVVYLPAIPEQIARIGFFHVFLDEKCGLYVVPVDKDTRRYMTDMTYTHVQLPEKNITLPGGFPAPPIERLRESVKTTPAITAVIPAPIAPSPAPIPVKP